MVIRLTSETTLDMLCYLYVQNKKSKSVILLLKLFLMGVMFTFQAEPENYTTSPDTVVYMPHCDLSLFETFLRDNWFSGRISNIILVGNDLSDHADQ